jgi:hypothetical protein
MWSCDAHHRAPATLSTKRTNTLDEGKVRQGHVDPTYLQHSTATPPAMSVTIRPARVRVLQVVSTGTRMTT